MIPAVKYANRKMMDDLKPFAVMFFLVYFISLWMQPHPIDRYSRFIWPHRVKAGETFNIIATVHRNAEGCNSRVVRTWEDGDGNLLQPPEVFNVPVPTENPELYRASPKIPDNAKPGVLYLKARSEFFCNWVQRLLGGSKFPIPDKRFRVIE